MSEPIFTDKEKQYLMLKVSKELYAVNKRIEVLDNGAKAGYIPSHVLDGSSPERQKKAELKALFEKLVAMPTTDRNMEDKKNAE